MDVVQNLLHVLKIISDKLCDLLEILGNPSSTTTIDPEIVCISNDNGEDGGCTSYANCKCSDSNNCEGGKECKDEVLPPIWLDAQTGKLEFNAMGDGNIVRVKLQIGNCIYYSNESGYENQIPCGNVRLEAFNYEWGFEIFPIIENDVPGVRTNGQPNYSPNSFVFQRLGGVPPNFTFTDVQTGEDPVGLRLLYSSTTEDYYRIKYTSPSTGCIYYSNIVGVIFP